MESLVGSGNESMEKSSGTGQTPIQCGEKLVQRAMESFIREVAKGRLCQMARPIDRRSNCQTLTQSLTAVF